MENRNVTRFLHLGGIFLKRAKDYDRLLLENTAHGHWFGLHSGFAAIGKK